jgi:hypothetical protein
MSVSLAKHRYEERTSIEDEKGGCWEVGNSNVQVIARRNDDALSLGNWEAPGCVAG